MQEAGIDRSLSGTVLSVEAKFRLVVVEVLYQARTQLGSALDAKVIHSQSYTWHKEWNLTVFRDGSGGLAHVIIRSVVNFVHEEKVHEYLLIFVLVFSPMWDLQTLSEYLLRVLSEFLIQVHLILLVNDESLVYSISIYILPDDIPEIRFPLSHSVLVLTLTIESKSVTYDIALRLSLGLHASLIIPVILQHKDVFVQKQLQIPYPCTVHCSVLCELSNKSL